MIIPRRSAILPFLIALALFLLPGFAKAEKPDILILHSYHPSLAWNIEMNRGILRVLDDELEGYTLVMEYLDSKRLFDDFYKQHLYSLYQYKYAASSFDAIIATDDDAFRFLMQYGEEIFPGVPVVFCGVNIFDPGLLAQHPNFTGVLEKVDVRSTLDEALRLFPETTHIYFIGDRSTTAMDLTRDFRQNIQHHYPDYTFRFEHHTSISAILQVLQHAPEESIALLWPFVGHEGNILIEMEALPWWISNSSNIPLFGFWHFNLGHGIVGGKLVSGVLQGENAARMATKIISGVHPSDIPVLKESPNAFFFDYNVLVKYGISISQLPPESTIINLPQTFTSRYRFFIEGVLAGLAVFCVLFFTFLYSDRKIKKVMKYELRFQQALMDALPNPVFYSFDNQRIEGCNNAFEKYTGISRDELSGKNLLAIYLPNQLQNHVAINQEIMLTHKPAIFEGNVLGPANVIRDVIFYKSAIFNKRTRTFGIIETIVDVTEKKLANEKMRQSEERYALATRATLDGIWDWNLVQKHLFVADRFKEILGYGIGDEPITHADFENHINPGDLGIFRHQFNTLRDGERESCSFEMRLRTRQNTWKWVELKAFAVSDTRGNVERLVGSVSDIQVRKESELALRKWEDIFKNTLMGIVISYPDSMKLDLINPVFAHMHGYLLEELMGKPIDAITATGEEEKVKTALKRAARENHYVFESMHCRPDGSCFPVMVDITAVKNNADTIVYFIINVQDISTRKRQEKKITQMLQREQNMNDELRSNQEELSQMLEQTLRYKEKLEENHNQFLSFFNGTRDFALLKDRNLRYLLVNEAFANFYNKTPEEFAGHTDLDVLPQPTAQKYLDADKQILETGQPLVYEEYFMGEYYETRKFPVFSGSQVIAIGAFIRNISQQKIAAQQIQASELRLKTLLENSIDLITLTNNMGEIQWSTETAWQLTGKDSVQLSGSNFLQIVWKEDRELWQQKFTECLNNPAKPVIVNHRIYSPGNGIMHFKSVLVNHLNNPAIKSVVITSHDISLEVQSQELQKNVIVARKSAEIKQQFLANMSHEIRTPMNGIIGMIELLQNTGLDDHQRDFVDIIRISSDSLLKIINDILDFSKIEAGKLTISKTPADIRRFLNDAYRLFTALARQKNLEFELVLDPDLPAFMLIDPIRLNQVISNLLSNAVKFTPSGKITLAATVEERDQENVTLYIEVSDTGIGIGAENQDQLFKAFSQIDSSLTRSQEGTGLGLAISRKIIEQMEGEIGVRSGAENGSVFWIRLRTQEVLLTDKTKKQHTEKELLPALGMDILLVEDKAVNQKVVKLMLEDMGCRVTVAGNGKIALDTIEQHALNPESKPFDAILMDIQMPVMDGITATRIIRQKYPHIRTIIGLSANVLSGDIESFMQGGLTDYIVKPAKSAEIRQKLTFWKQNA